MPILQEIFVKMIASKILRRVAKSVLIRYLEVMAERTDNDIDDEIVEAIKKALR